MLAAGVERDHGILDTELSRRGLREPWQETDDLGAIRNGLAVTSDEAVWTWSEWLSGDDLCRVGRVDASVVAAIFAGVAPLLEGIGGCASAIAARTASDLYVSIMDLDPIDEITPGVYRVSSAPSGFTSERVAEMPGYEAGAGLPTSCCPP
jgi:hypothetical protein